MIRVALCIPSPALRAGLRALLAADPDLPVVASAASLAELAGEGDFDVIITVQELPAGAVSVPILLVTSDPHAVDLLRESEPGSAWGAISPDAPGEALQAAVRALAEGLVVLSPGLYPAAGGAIGGADSGADLDPDALARQSAAARRPDGKPAASVQAGSAAQPGAPLDTLDPLTPREIEVLRALAEGLTNKQIALALGISEHTAKFHVSSIYSKLGVSNRAEAVRTGARRGWLPL